MNVRISKNVYTVRIHCNIYYDLMKYLVYRFASYVEKTLANGCSMQRWCHECGYMCSIINTGEPTDVS